MAELDQTKSVILALLLSECKWFDRVNRCKLTGVSIKEFSSMVLYITGALLVFGVSFRAFWKDTSTPKTDRLSWMVLMIATLFWPLVLPSIIRKKLAKSTATPLKAQLSQ
nr:MAG: hypothetical protein EDM05_05610 [Leptolyngbya sp. IPPAS B-1204]